MKRENGFCVFPTSDSQPLEYCSAIVRLLPLGGANKEREGVEAHSVFSGEPSIGRSCCCGPKSGMLGTFNQSMNVSVMEAI